MTDRTQLRHMLLSVYDKEGFEELVTASCAAGVELVSTGPTAIQIAAAGIPVTPVGQLTRFPECPDGRVRTLHPRIHASTLANHRLLVHISQLKELGVAPFDLTVANLYPFEATVAFGVGADECVEQINIGGPSTMCVATKSHPSVAVVTSTSQHPVVLATLAEGGFTLQQRRDLATEVFRHTASYDIAVAFWMGATVTAPAGDRFPAWLGAAWVKKQDLRYGKNSHQAVASYTYPPGPEGIVQAELLRGRPMSYNNYTDSEATYHAASDFTESCVAIIRCANLCGIAVGSGIAEVHRRAHTYDPVPASGGVITANCPVTTELAEQIEDIFTEVVIAPGFDPEVLVILATKKNLQLLKAIPYIHREHALHPISGGALPQRPDHIDAPGDDPADWELKVGEATDDVTLVDLVFMWRTCRAMKSNAILLTHDGASAGVGMGQVNRIDSCRLAVRRAGERAVGSTTISNAFFPFADGSRILVDGGVRAVIRLGGSLCGQEIVDLRAGHDVTLYFTDIRHFLH